MNRDGSKSRAKATAAARCVRRLPTSFFGEELTHVEKQVFFECLYVAERIGSPGRTRTCNISVNSECVQILKPCRTVAYGRVRLESVLNWATAGLQNPIRFADTEIRPFYG
jgi:hypothetical protein